MLANYYGYVMKQEEQFHLQKLLLIHSVTFSTLIKVQTVHAVLGLRNCCIAYLSDTG